MHARAGDEIIVDSREVGGPRRTGEILEIRDADAIEHYVVRWDDGHESIFYPGSDAHVVHFKATR